MNLQQVYQQYQRTQVETANPGKLVIMLYQGGIKFLKLAKKSMEDNDLEGVNNYLIRTQDIINELMVTLDLENGGEIAENLYRLYEFMNYQLIQANIKKEGEPIVQVEELLVELLDAWEQIVNGTKLVEEDIEVNLKG